MKFRNTWRYPKLNWKAVAIRIRISAFDILSIELDFTRDFYLFTLMNFTIKNR